MINTIEFNKVIDSDFWRHITSESTYADVINWKDILKKDFLIKLAHTINNFEHNFKSPDYIFFSKELGILRRVKSFNLSDTSIYYYCLKKLQSDIVPSIKSIAHVYGGFRLSPDLKLNKEDLDKLVYDPLYETFAKFNYRVEWSEYQNLAKALSDKNYDYYIHIDIAHFYDDVNLDILERELRNNTSQREIVDLLFYFLKNSDKRDLGYISNTSGIPQEEVGEMSRLLASFYLHQFDKRISKQIKKVLDGKEFLFTRYADDMWIVLRGNKIDAQKITQIVSSELLKLKLHINEKKLKFYTKAEFDIYWHFETWEKIKLIKGNPNQVLILLKKCFKEKKGRWFSPFFYLLKIFLNDVKNVDLIKKFKSHDFLLIFLDTPQLAFKTKQIHYKFFEAFFNKYPDNKKLIVDLVKENNFIHPHIEFFCLSVYRASCSPKDEVFKNLYEYYFKAVRRTYQWYSRCICLVFFIDHLSFLEADKPKRDKLLLQLKNASSHFNEIERRYSLYLIHRLSRFAEAKDMLANTFNYPSDLKFINYLSAL